MNRYLKRFEPPRVALALALVWGAAALHTSSAQGLYNGPGGIVSISDSARYVRGDVENAGEFHLTPAAGLSTRLFIDEGNLLNTASGTWATGPSTVVMLGLGTTPHTLSMHGATLHHLRLDNPAGTLLGSDATVAGALKLANGHLLTTEAHSLRLGPEGSVFGPAYDGREDGAHYVKGSLVQQKTVAGSADVSFGNMGVVLNPQGQTLTVSVDRRTGLGQPGYSYARSRDFADQQSIDRIWRFSTPEGGSLSKAVTLTLQWLPENDHKQDFSAGQAQVWRSTNHGASWVKEGSPQEAAARTVTVTTNQLNAWYTVSSTRPAPVLDQLVFSGTARQLDAVLSWSTSTRPGNGWFVIERSANGQQWREISRQPVASQHWSPAASTAVDKDAGRLAGTLYYRLRQLDINGNTQATSSLMVRFARPIEFTLEAYPIPLQEYLTLDLSTATEGPLLIELYDMSGRLLLSRREKAPAGTSRYQLSVRALPTGVYSLRVSQGTQLLIRPLLR